MKHPFKSWEREMIYATWQEMGYQSSIITNMFLLFASLGSVFMGKTMGSLWVSLCIFMIVFQAVIFIKDSNRFKQKEKE